MALLLRRTAAAAALASGGAALALVPAHWEPGWDAPPAVARALSALPLDAAARAGARLADLPLPRAVRAPLLRAYAASDADLDGYGSLDGYRSLKAFWGRRREGVRGGGGYGVVEAPCGGVVVAAGVVGDRGVLPLPAGAEGVEWGVRELLAAEDRDRLSRAEEAERFELTAVVLRLAPRRDSHWMQAPVAWVVRERRKVGGGAAWLDAPGDLAYGRNVRAPWVGDWAHGMFAATVVGGPGYGELVELEDAEALEGKGEVALEQGAGIGVLRAGSAVVLVFEAPVGAFEMKVAQGATVVAGDCLGRVNLANLKEVASTPQPVTSKRKSAAVPSGRRARRSW